LFNRQRTSGDAIGNHGLIIYTICDFVNDDYGPDTLERRLIDRFSLGSSGAMLVGPT
jgi:hypothetical protein